MQTSNLTLKGIHGVVQTATALQQLLALELGNGITQGFLLTRDTHSRYNDFVQGSSILLQENTHTILCHNSLRQITYVRDVQLRLALGHRQRETSVYIGQHTYLNTLDTDGSANHGLTVFL